MQNKKNLNKSKMILTKRFGMLDGPTVRDTIIKQGMKASEAVGFTVVNFTKGALDTGKGALTVHSGKRLATTAFKAGTDFVKGDVICCGLCSVAACCETASGIIVWIPMPAGKICTISALKTISLGCERIRDLCAADPLNPLCK